MQTQSPSPEVSENIFETRKKARGTSRRDNLAGNASLVQVQNAFDLGDKLVRYCATKLFLVLLPHPESDD